MKKQLYCYECDKKVKGIIEKEVNTYNVRGVEVFVEEDIFICPVCKGRLSDDDLDNDLYKIYNAYLQIFNLSFEKLKEIRISLKLSQELFAKALGWSKKTVVRYENAESLPQGEYLLTYQRLLTNINEIFTILRFNRPLIEEKTYYKILQNINAEVDYKTINVFLYFLNNISLTKTKIMKYLFASDFLCIKEHNFRITSLKYAHAPFGPVINNKDSILNCLIMQGFIELISDNSEYMLFDAKVKCDLSVFSDKELEIMSKVYNKFADKSSKDLSDWSHSFIGWADTQDGEEINFKYAKNLDIDSGWV